MIDTHIFEKTFVVYICVILIIFYTFQSAHPSTDNENYTSLHFVHIHIE